VKVYVPDASVIIKWVIGADEPGQDKALALLRGWLKNEHEFIVPSLWFYEVGNVLGVKRPKDAGQIMEVLLDYEFEECKMTGIIAQTAFELMKEYKGVTFYDAIYHAVALRKNAVMVTADRSYFGRVKDKGKVMLI